MAAAIDFGTHGSGFAWCAVNEGEEPADRRIDFFDQWKDQPVSYPKNLSALLLDDDGRVLEWGYAARRARANKVKGRFESGFKTWLKPDAEEGGTPRRRRRWSPPICGSCATGPCSRSPAAASTPTTCGGA
ncbi:hypothetical protein ACFQ60_38405 [Streptomyces zhihengii]